MSIYYYLAAFFGALLASLVLTPLVRRIARGWRFIDTPDGHRKLHGDPIALGGGLAVLAATCATSIPVIVTALAYSKLSLDLSFPIGLAVAVAILTAVGVVDDAIGMRGRYKLAGQAVACLVLMALGGLQVHGVSVFGLQFDLGVLAIPVTLVWLLGTINAINLLDGADGLAASIGVLLCLTVGTLAAFGGHLGDCLLPMAMAGALMGFLRYNFAPASIYLGDTGSMLIGLVVGAIAVHSGIKGSTSVALATPVCMLAIPIFDSCAALMRRKLTGRSLFAPDRGHFHHMLLHRGCSVRQTVLLIAGVCFITCLGALVSVYCRKDIVAISTAIFVIVSLVTCRIFGHVEFGLIVNSLSLRSRVRSWIDWKSTNSNDAVQRVYHLYGSRNWNDVWLALSESAETMGLIRLEFRILVPSIHESYYAVWAKPSKAPAEERWMVNSPLFLGDRLAGNILLSGHSDSSAIEAVGAVADFLEPIEDHIRHSADEHRQHDARESIPRTPSSCGNEKRRLRHKKPVHAA